MRYLHTTFVILFFALSIFFSFGVQETFASRYLSQVNEDSSSVKVKKLQEVFKGLGLYKGEVDGNFFSIRESLIDYQVENGIIPDREHNEAGYFGNKTIKSLKQKFGSDFEKLQEEYLKLEEPKVNQEGYFIVTAYYTPLPNQEKYSTGSYEAEKKLNGGGNTASGTKPTPGTIAAPRNYPFGMKIYLEGIGVGVVEDRGGAIVNSGDKGHLHDRLDVWMGYGDEGRERTRLWGVKTVKGNILDKSSEVKVNFEVKSESEVFAEQEEKFSKRTEIDKYRNIYISPENPDTENVKSLQDLLKKVNLYNGKIDGNFDSVKNILINFQFENGVISSKNSSEAGYFGNKTFEAFSKKFGKNLENLSKNEKINNVVVLKNENNSSLSNKDKQRIKKIRDEFIRRVKSNYSGTNFDIYIKDTKNNLSKSISKLDTDKKKNILKYFIEIL